MMKPRIRDHRRSAFTLIELMMAAALALVIMTVLAVAFRSGMDTMSQMKSVAGLASQLRSVTNIMRSDLEANPALGIGHLEADPGAAAPPFGPGPGIARVSDRSKLGTGWTSPNRGFFKVTAPLPPASPPPAPQPRTLDGSVEAGIDTFVCTGDSLHFTVKRGESSLADVFRAKAPNTPPNDLGSRADMRIGLSGPDTSSVTTVWAEVIYFLRPSGEFTDGIPVKSPLHTLYRRERVIAPPEYTGSVSIPMNQYPDLSVNPNDNTINTPLTITTAANRFPSPYAEITAPADMKGSDILLSNVISFQVDSIADNESSYGARTWDSSATGGVQLRGISIKIRVYDPKNRIVRQMTLNQAL